MKRLFRLAVRLYPTSWRERYGREFDVLLEDLKPGWGELFDIVRGAITMQIKTLGTVPAVCALAGAIVGAAIAMQTPTVFASSATIRFSDDLSDHPAQIEPARAQKLQTVLGKVLATSSDEERRSTTVVVRDNRTVKLTYLDRDPAKGQRTVEKLAAAITAELAESSRDVPQRPTPMRPGYPMKIASGGGVGLIAGSIALLFLRSRRRSGTRGVGN
jgi:hypothetical protein